ncbi:ATPase [Sulfurifustis variabilis]|uniref:ATPase n=1 Tax=Sulfurifustis variabilis TaxID=1675686 RepID=A0A1B4V5Q6_9GAMM|nr:AAA family ATPase [Sulfurifustis variabilis]BAU47902.1 ATPase [Sulfurifustis variabilis]
MYLEFFKLREFPFRLTPDTEFLYMSDAHARAKAYMDYTIWNRDGFVVITGEIGSGKTTLIQKLLSELDDNVLVAKIFQTQLDEVEFLQAVLVEFGLNPFHAKKVELIDMLNTFLIDQFHKDKQLVLIVDDAHNLSPKVLEEIRMLSGLETQKEKVLHVILVGHPQLNELLESAEMEQLLQRVRLRYHIKALSEEATRAYITHRLRVAGMEERHLFAAETFPLIYKYTGGLPRLINTLCDTALVCAYADGQTAITGHVLNSAIEELQWLPYAKRVNQRRLRPPPAANNEYQEVLKDHARALVNVGHQMTRLDALVPALNALAGRMGNIESLLRNIASALDMEPKAGKSESKTLAKRD